MVIAGIDEVGRGCMAGAVVAAAVILDPSRPIDGLADSKKLTPRQRRRLAAVIKARCLVWSVGRAEASEIDRINILQASLLAMQRAYFGLAVKPDWIKVDGNRYPDIPCGGETVVQGDRRVAEISAASIVAKVARDDEMGIVDALFPGYDFSAHKAYSTREHLARLRQRGPCELHRRSFAPVKAVLAKD